MCRQIPMWKKVTLKLLATTSGFNHFLYLYESLTFMLSDILLAIWTKQIIICFHHWRTPLFNCHLSRHCSCFQSLVTVFWFILLMKGLTGGGCSLRTIHLNDKHSLLRHFQVKSFHCLTCHIHWCVKMRLGFFFYFDMFLRLSVIMRKIILFHQNKV